MQLLSRLDIEQIARAYLLSKNTKIDPTLLLTEGTNANIFVGTTAVVGEAIMRQLAQGMSTLLLDGAEGDDLDRYAIDRYGDDLTRKGAAPAVGAVSLSRATAAAGAGSLPIGTGIQTQSNVQYVTTQVASFGLTDLVAAPIAVRAAAAGKSSQVGRNYLRRFTTPSAIFDSSLVVTNPEPTAGGEDAEDDDTYRNRIRTYWSSARRGTLPAIVQGATSVPGVVSAQAYEVITGNNAPARLVELYIADSSGVANAQLAAQVATSLLEYRAGGIQVLVFSSIPLLVPISLALAFQAGTDAAGLTSLVLSAVVQFVNSLGVNQPLLVSDLIAVLKRYSNQGLLATSSSVVQPPGDLFPQLGQTIRTTPALVTATASSSVGNVVSISLQVF